MVQVLKMDTKMAEEILRAVLAEFMKAFVEKPETYGHHTSFRHNPEFLLILATALIFLF